MTARLVVWVLFVVLARPAMCRAQEDAVKDPWLAENVFTGIEGCLSVGKGQRLEAGERVLVFEPGAPAAFVAISRLIPTASARRIFEERGYRGVYQDSVLRDSVGCSRNFTFEEAAWIARLEAGGGLPVAIRALPRDAWIAGGMGHVLSPADLARVVEEIGARVSPKFTAPGVLRVGYRFPSPGGHDITRLFLGRAFYRKGAQTPGAPAAIDSIQICEAFLHRGRLLGTEEYSRISGEMERAETEPPELDTRNWHDVQSQTMGFFSLDAGITWRHVMVDVGFEGIYWAISGLAGKVSLLWDSYLYTAHGWGRRTPRKDMYPNEDHGLDAPRPGP
jgi:hypothetical protein